MVWEPARSVSMSLDYWLIRRRNEVSILSEQEIVDNEDSTDPRYVGRVVRGPADPNNPDIPGPIQTVTTGYFNLGETQASGLDLDARYTASLGEYGKLTLGAQASFTLAYKVKATADSQTANYVGFNNHPRWKGSFSVGWETGPFTATLSADVTGGYKTYDPPQVDATGPEDCLDPDGTYVGICHVGAWTVYDLALGYKGIKNLELNFVVRNIGNRKPPVDPYWYSLPAFNADFHSAKGRQFALSASYKF